VCPRPSSGFIQLCSWRTYKITKISYTRADLHKNIHKLRNKKTLILCIRYGVTRPSCHETELTIWYYCNTPRHDKWLTKNVLLIKMLNVISQCVCVWIVSVLKQDNRGTRITIFMILKMKTLNNCGWIWWSLSLTRYIYNNVGHFYWWHQTSGIISTHTYHPSALYSTLYIVVLTLQLEFSLTLMHFCIAIYIYEEFRCKSHLKFSSLMMIFIKLVYLSSVISLKWQW